MGESSRRQIQHREGGKSQSGGFCGGYGVSGPLERLSEVVGGGDQFEGASARNLISGLARRTQITQNLITMDVDRESGDKQDNSKDKSHGMQIIFGILIPKHQ